MFKTFMITEDKRLTFEIQQYLLDNVNSKLDPDIEIEGVNKLRIKTNVGLDRELIILANHPDTETKLHEIQWKVGAENHPHTMSVAMLVDYVNECVAMLTHYDVFTSAGKTLRDYWVIDVNRKVILPIIPQDKEVADFCFKLFPKPTVNTLLSAGILDKPKLLAANNATSISQVVEAYKDLVAKDDSNALLFNNLLNALANEVIDHNNEQDMQDVLKHCNVDELKKLLFHSTSVKFKLAITKAGRTKQDREFDDENDRFVFIGSEKFVPVPGTKHHKKTLEIENLYKVDKFDLSDHGTLKMMHMRARVQNANVYMVHLPKGFITSKANTDLPEWLVDLIDKHKQKI
jgi:hypothetical protein